MQNLTLKNRLKAYVLDISSVVLGMSILTFFAQYFIDNPIIAWLLLIVINFKNLRTELSSSFRFKLLSSFLNGVILVIFFILFLLSTQGKTGFFGDVYAEHYALLTGIVFKFLSFAFILLAVFFGVFYFLEKNNKFNPKIWLNIFASGAVLGYILFLASFGRNLVPLDFYVFGTGYACINMTYSLWEITKKYPKKD